MDVEQEEEEMETAEVVKANIPTLEELASAVLSSPTPTLISILSIVLSAPPPTPILIYSILESSPKSLQSLRQQSQTATLSFQTLPS